MPETTAKPPKRPAKAKTATSQGVAPSQGEEAPIAVKKTGRPSKYTPEIAQEVLNRISTGEPLLQICMDERMPKRQTFYDWVAKHDSLSVQFARAREEGCDAMADETLVIADERPELNPLIDKKTGEVLNMDLSSAYIQWQKNRIDTRLKLLACWNPSKYGTKVQMGGDPKNPLKIEVKTEAEQSLAELLKHAELKRQAANAE
jgi:hypothetical protein